MFKFTREGIIFTYHGDQVLRRWPWGTKGVPVYSSHLYDRDFNSFREYWMMIGRQEGLVQASSHTGKFRGYHFVDVLGDWLRHRYGGEYVVVLSNIDYSRRGPDFWSKLPREHIDALSKDVVVLRCQDRTQVSHIVRSVDSGFAVAEGFFNGDIIYSNEDEG